MRLNLSKRLAALEGTVLSILGHPHRVIYDPAAGETLDSALDAYGRDKIGPNDRIYARRIIDADPQP